MSTRHGRGPVLFGGLLVGLLAVGGRAEEAPPTRPIAAKGAVAPAAPVLPAEVVAAMQEGRFAEAGAALDRARRPEGQVARRPGLSRPDPRHRRAAGGPARRGPRRPGRGDRGGAGGALGGQAPVRAGRRRAGRRPLRRGRGPGPRRGRGAPGRRPQGPPRRGLPRLRPPAARAPTTRSPRPTPRAPTPCWARPAAWPRGTTSAPGSCSRWAAPARPASNHAAGHRGLPGLPEGVSRGGRPRRRPVPPGRGATGRRPAARRPA